MKRTGNRPSKNLDYGAEHKGANITTDKNRPAKSVNFSGSASLDTQKNNKQCIARVNTRRRQRL